MEYKRKKWEEYKNINDIIEHLKEVEEKTIKFLNSTKEDNLSRMIKFELSSGESFDLSVEEALFQSFTEQLYHMGELIACLWQMNVEPPKMQWFYNNPRKK